MVDEAKHSRNLDKNQNMNEILTSIISKLDGLEKEIQNMKNMYEELYSEMEYIRSVVKEMEDYVEDMKLSLD